MSIYTERTITPQRRTEELGRRLVERDSAVQQLSTSNEQLQAKVDELLGAKQQLELALATAKSSVTANETQNRKGAGGGRVFLQ